MLAPIHGPVLEEGSGLTLVVKLNAMRDADNRKRWYASSGQSHRRAERQRKLRAEKRAYIAAAKNKPCMDCKQSFPPYVMDFDHRDPKDKKFSVSRICDDNVSWENLKAEIAKCDLVCANCHRIRTWGCP